MKYKTCCNKTCLLLSCNIRDNGGCYCACRMNDKIEAVKSIIAGKSFERGNIYVLDYENYFNQLTDEKKQEELAFREEMKKLLPELEKEFKKRYVLDS